MKATGIVRRIDDLGRVVIPKEIRRTLRIKEGTPLEIFTDKEGEIILKNVFAYRRIESFRQRICRGTGTGDRNDRMYHRPRSGGGGSRAEEQGICR